MEKKRRFVIILFILVSIFLIFSLYSFNKSFSGFTIFDKFLYFSNKIITYVGQVFIDIKVNFFVNIDSPQNTTYNFSIGSDYNLSLNVSSNRNITIWTYYLTDLKHNVLINQNTSFTPNITFTAVRWSNQLVVYAVDSLGITKNDSVVFFISVPNSAPILDDINNLYVCEGNYLSSFFNISDVDEDTLSVSILSPDPFYIALFQTFNLTAKKYEIFSGTLSKANAGGVNNGFKVYQENISVSDSYNGSCCADSKTFNITVIEINNAPSITPIGVQTIWADGENNTFYHKTIVSDVEDGNQDSGNLTFNISFSGNFLFNISSNGIMNYTANSSYLGVHNISVCVNDSGLISPHENISLCSQNGGSRTSCSNFSLTITKANRAPNITSYSPSNLTLSVFGEDILYFNISKNDPDGTIPDGYWYVDDILKEYDSGDSTDEFIYSFGCGVSGNHTVKAIISDGSLNYSVQWNVSVSLITCTVSVSAGGGGGGSIGKPFCKEKWGCGEWEQCKNLENYYKLKKISSGYEFLIKERCKILNWNDDICGFQMRNCTDINKCGTNFTKPSIIKECYYTEFPTCEDGILNCHDGSCEVLVDCGGPCKVCPTCSDGIQNQNEEGIDCGGPCPACIKEIPKPMVNKILLFFWSLLFLLFLLALILIIILIVRYHKRERALRKITKKSKE